MKERKKEEGRNRLLLDLPLFELEEGVFLLFPPYIARKEKAATDGCRRGEEGERKPLRLKALSEPYSIYVNSRNNHCRSFE